ncbi:MAG: ArsA family ATPase [Gemmatimonadales bacterium]|nr:ArsA family ATPase [Gemmatimonadales bacterium]
MLNLESAARRQFTELLLRRPILFFGGKGGVGKTTLAATVALRSAASDRRTLLVSTDPAHSIGDALGVRLGNAAREVAPNLWAVEIDPAEEADRYIAGVKGRIAAVTPPRLVAEVDRQIDIARVTPGAEEAALFDRFTRLMDEAGEAYDRVVFDTAPLGHTLRLLALPEQMQRWIRGLIGRRRKVNVLQRMWRNVAGAAAGDEGDDRDPILAALEERQTRFARARATVVDPARAAFVFVVVPERLPILETERAVRTLGQYGIPVGAVLVNRVLPLEADGAFAERRRTEEADRLSDLERRFRAYPLLPVPQLPRDVQGVDDLQELGRRLFEATGP